MSTPIEELHDAIARFVEQTSDVDGVVSAFILEYEVTSFTDEEGVEARITHHDYTTGPGTTLATALGLEQLLRMSLSTAAAPGGEE